MKIISRPIEIGKVALVKDCNSVVRSAKVLDIEGGFAKVAINMGSGVKLIEKIRYE